MTPSHYSTKAIQPIEYILANKLSFCEGNVIKYVTRYSEKNGLEDLIKAKQYIQYLIDREETKENTTKIVNSTTSNIAIRGIHWGGEWGH